MDTVCVRNEQKKMRRIVIITAKIRSKYAKLIRNGAKTYEVRDETFADAQAIHYIGQDDGADWGTYSIERTFSLGREDDGKLIAYASIPADEFYELFPSTPNGGPERLWVAQIGARLDIEGLIGGSR